MSDSVAADLAQRRVPAFIPLLLLAACAPDIGDKLAGLPLPETSRAALSRLRFAPLRTGDRVAPGDLVVCGAADRAMLGFSRRHVEAYLGRDAAWALNELFAGQTKDEVLLEVPPGQLLRLDLPRGIGSEAGHPDGWARHVEGSPLYTSDVRYVEWLFNDGANNELFAVKREAGGAATSPAPGAEGATPSPPGGDTPWRLGVETLPRMGPRQGVVVSRVLAGSPADRAGLTPGDRILTVGGTPVATLAELRSRLSTTNTPTIIMEVRKNKKESIDRLVVTLVPFGTPVSP